MLTRLGSALGMLICRRLDVSDCAEYASGDDDGESGAWRRERRSTEAGVRTEVGAAEADTQRRQEAAKVSVYPIVLQCWPHRKSFDGVCVATGCVHVSTELVMIPSYSDAQLLGKPAAYTRGGGGGGVAHAARAVDRAATVVGRGSGEAAPVRGAVGSLRSSRAIPLVGTSRQAIGVRASLVHPSLRADSAHYHRLRRDSLVERCIHTARLFSGQTGSMSQMALVLTGCSSFGEGTFSEPRAWHTS